MLLAPIVAISVAALVLALLISQVIVRTRTASTNHVQDILTYPRVPAVIAFPVGSPPWALWESLQDRAAKLIG